MSKQQAIRPNIYQEFTDQVEDVLDEDKELDEDQQALAYITHYKGWALLKEYKERLETYLDESLSNAISAGASMKEIGERALIKEMAMFVLDSFVAKADDARRAEDNQ